MTLNNFSLNRQHFTPAYTFLHDVLSLAKSSKCHFSNIIDCL